MTAKHAIVFAVVGLGLACGEPQATPLSSATPTPSSSSVSAFFDTSPRQLVANFPAGIGGEMACSTSLVVFTDGSLHGLFVTPVAAFQPRKLLTVAGTIGPLSMSGNWVAFSVYTQRQGLVTPLASWTVNAVEVTSGRAIQLAAAGNATELTEMPRVTAGDGFIAWDELVAGPVKTIWVYDTSSGARRRLSLPSGQYPVGPSAYGHTLLYADNSQDPAHASETWVNRGGEPWLLDVTTGAATRLASGSVVFAAVLADNRAVWMRLLEGSAQYAIEGVSLSTRAVSRVSDSPYVAPLWANGDVTVWLAGVRGAVTAHLGNRTALVTPDLTTSPGGMALCAHTVYYAGPDLSLRAATVG